MSGREEDRRQHRRFAARGNGHEQRDPRDVAEIERLQQRIRELELNQFEQDDSANKFIEMSGREEDRRQNRRFAAGGNGFEQRDPRDIEIERLRQRIQDLVLNQPVYKVSATFKVVDMSPYEPDEDDDSRTSHFFRGGG